MAARPRKKTESLDYYHAKLKQEEEEHQKRMAPKIFWDSSRKGTYYK